MLFLLVGFFFSGFVLLFVESSAFQSVLLFSRCLGCLGIYIIYYNTIYTSILRSLYNLLYSLKEALPRLPNASREVCRGLGRRRLAPRVAFSVASGCAAPPYGQRCKAREALEAPKAARLGRGGLRVEDREGDRDPGGPLKSHLSILVL